MSLTNFGKLNCIWIKLRFIFTFLNIFILHVSTISHTCEPAILKHWSHFLLSVYINYPSPWSLSQDISSIWEMICLPVPLKPADSRKWFFGIFIQNQQKRLEIRPFQFEVLSDYIWILGSDVHVIDNQLIYIKSEENILLQYISINNVLSLTSKKITLSLTQWSRLKENTPKH